MPDSFSLEQAPQDPTGRARVRREHPDLVRLPAGHPNVIDPSTLQGALDWTAIFGATATNQPKPKRVLELGCATGTFLLHRAQQPPAAILIGVEYANKYFIKSAERARKHGLANIRAIRTEASTFVHQHIGPDSLDECHIYHPDPWPKERHHKRRLVQIPFLQTIKRALRPGGFVVFQSDHAEYFPWALERFQQVFPEVKLHPEPWSDAPAGRTNWEIKFLRQGLPIWRLVARV